MRPAKIHKMLYKHDVINMMEPQFYINSYCKKLGLTFNYVIVYYKSFLIIYTLKSRILFQIQGKWLILHS